MSRERHHLGGTSHAMPCPRDSGRTYLTALGRAIALSAALALLAACEGVPLFGNGAGETATEDQPAEAAAEERTTRPEEEMTEAEAAQLAEAETQVTALPPEPVIDDDPAQLIGMGPATLSAFLGAPQLIRREAPASLWQYTAQDCVLDVVFYPDKGADRVSYVEARQDGLDLMPARDCLNRLIRKRRGLPLG
jgi:hypothetical protein